MAAEGNTAKTQIRPRRRKAFVAFLLCVALLTLGWLVFERFILNIDRYRGEVERQITESTGLPASIGRLDLDLFPTPHIRVHGLALGESGFMLAVDVIDIYADLYALAEQRIDIENIVVPGGRLSVPADINDLRARIEAIAEHIQAQSSDAETPDVSIARVLLQRLDVYRAGDAEPYCRVRTLSGVDILSPNARGRLQLGRFLDDESASLQIDVAAAPEADRVATATATARTRFDRLVAFLELPPVDAHAAAEFTLYESGLIAGALTGGGTVEYEGRMHEGSVKADLWWENETLTANDIAINTEGGSSLAADATRQPDGSVALSVSQAVIAGPELEILLVSATTADVALAPTPAGKVTVTDFLAGIDPKGVARLAQGAVDVEGVAVTVYEEDFGCSFDTITVGFDIAENTLTIRNADVPGGNVAGRLRADFDAQQVHAELRGHLDLAKDTFPLLQRLKPLEGISGRLEFERFNGTFSLRNVKEWNIDYAGTMAAGNAVWLVGGRRVTLAGEAIAFQGDRHVVNAEIHATSPEVGAVRFAGEYGIKPRTLNGRLSANAPDALRPWLDSDGRKRWLEPFALAYGNVETEAAIQFPTRDRKQLDVRVEQETVPPLTIEAHFRELDEDRLELASLAVDARVLMEQAPGLMPENVDITGPANMALRTTDGGFEATATLGEATVIAGPVEKPAGESLSLRFAGTTNPDPWRATSVAVEAAGQRAEFRIEGERLASDSINLQLQPLAPYIRSVHQIRGKLTGSVKTNPVDLALTIDEGAVELDESVAIQNMAGGIAYREGLLTLRDLKLVAANSNVTLDIERTETTLNGAVKAERLQSEEALQFWKDVEAYLDESRLAGDGEGASKPAPPTGRLTLAIDDLGIRRAHLQGVSATAELSANGIQLNDVRAVPYTGRLAGTIHLGPETEEARTIDAALTLEGADARLFDELFYDEPRGLKGAVNATVTFQGPAIHPAEAIKRGDGRFQFSARDGTFGQMGFATKLLTALKTTAILQLELPSLRDEGLTYSTTSGTLTLRKGVMTIDPFTLDGTAYYMEGGGVADFALDATKAVVHVRLLESVNRLADRVPIVRDLAGMTTKHVGVAVHFSGSPFDLKYRVETGGPVSGVRDAIRSLIPR